ncbi:MAG: hypothetical protein LBJ41_03275 [Treponema sp.]|jgi:hypothetical protein|nr:hypothetical protein [Treponema sp.]
MKKTLYKPQNDDLDVNVAVYAAEAFIDWRCSDSKSDNPVCKKPSNPPIDKGIDFFCKNGNGKRNIVCPRK